MLRELAYRHDEEQHSGRWGVRQYPQIGSGTLDSRPRRRKDVRTRDTPAYSKCSRVVVIGQHPLSGKGAPMGRVEGKVAFITGGARGQGRSHAVRLAEEGADIIAVDICQSLPTVPYEGASRADLDGTAELVEDLDRRIVVREADVRDLSQLEAAVEEGLSELGHIDVVCCNAGIGTFAPALEMDEQMWQEMIDVNPTGVWKTIRAVAPRWWNDARGDRSSSPARSPGCLVLQPGQLLERQARRGGAHADPDPGVGPVHDPGQQRAPDDGQHSHDHE